MKAAPATQAPSSGRAMEEPAWLFQAGGVYRQQESCEKESNSLVSSFPGMDKQTRDLKTRKEPVSAFTSH